MAMPAETRENTEKPRYVPERDLVVWEAPSRPFKRRGREYYVSLFAIVALVGFIFLIVEGIMPVILLVSLTFLFYVLSTVRPERIQYKITNKGIRLAGNILEWDIITNFWFSGRGESSVLTVETLKFPGKLELVIEGEKKEEIRKILLDYIPEEKTPPSSGEKMLSWVSKRIPGH